MSASDPGDPTFLSTSLENLNKHESIAQVQLVQNAANSPILGGTSGRKRGRQATNTIVNAFQNAAAKKKRSTRNSKKVASTPSVSNSDSIIEIPDFLPPVPGFSSAASTTSRGRGRQRRQATPRRQNQSRTVPSNSNNHYPTYNIGNTDFYPDQSEQQKLFSDKPKPKTEEIVELDDDSLLDENEEMSVKVNWQSFKIHLFKIRKFQKITQIFEYFAKQENVDRERLLFTYKDKILKTDDTPDSIDYSVAKFIEGGVLSNAIKHTVDTSSSAQSKSGLKIKFQCQNIKKPFETYVEPYEKLLYAMTKCAEHLECPLSKLKFNFDGDSITSIQTPKDLDFEGDECIDVKILS